MNAEVIHERKREESHGLELLIMLFILALVVFGSLQPSPARGRTSSLAGELGALETGLTMETNA
ncbi:hypothetical protein [Paucidesulfovibrio longus]|uniref:hypothetical protein n=1 Tax=Paucidesulfovibrio longus TaxID=889 RepID=UPI0003B3BD2A|nr:hypothetical protein [Paucidesulfovibrio longus]